jgi:hypothetical protein
LICLTKFLEWEILDGLPRINITKSGKTKEELLVSIMITTESRSILMIKLEAISIMSTWESLSQSLESHLSGEENTIEFISHLSTQLAVPATILKFQCK